MISALLIASLYSPTSINAAASVEPNQPSADDVSGSDVTQSAEEALSADIAAVAEEEGTSVEAVERDYRSSEALGEIAIKASSRWPDQFVGSAVSPADKGGPTLYIKGAAPAELLELADTQDVRVVDQQPYSFEELETRDIAAHQALVELGYLFATTSFSVENGRWIEANVAGTAADGAILTEAQIIRALPAGLRDDVRLTVDQDTGGYGDVNSFGGMLIRGGGNDICTSGWAVESTETGTTGVSTAGHCTGVDHIVHPGDGSHTTDYRAEHRGAWGDVEWHTTPQPEPDNFYASASDVRDVASVAQIAGISQDDYVCFYGRFSNDQFCGLQVLNVSVTCTASGVTNNRLVRMDDDGPLELGDSGGPWFYGTQAYGSTKGWCNNNAAFSVAAYYDAAIDVRVRR